MKKFTVSIWASTTMSVTVYADNAEEAIDRAYETNLNKEMLTTLLCDQYYSWDLGGITKEDVEETDGEIHIGFTHNPTSAFPHNDGGAECIDCTLDNLRETLEPLYEDGYPDGVTCACCGDIFYQPINAQEA